MAKKTKRASRSPKKSTAKSETATTSSRAISQAKFQELCGVRASNKKAAGERGKVLGDKVKSAVDNDGLNRKAWSIHGQLDALEDHDRMAVIFHLNTYGFYSGWWDQKDMIGYPGGDGLPKGSTAKPDKETKNGKGAKPDADKPDADKSTKAKNAETLKAAAGLGADEVDVRPPFLRDRTADAEAEISDAANQGRKPPVTAH